MSDELRQGPDSGKTRLEDVLDDKKFLGHPRGVGALAAGNFFNSFAWGALYAILIYYLYSPYTQGLGFTQGQAASMVTAMGACNSIFIILGSWLADRVLGMRKALIIGNIVKGTAFGLLAIPAFSLAQGRIFAILGLFLMSLPIMGASNASLTGQLYRKADNGRRDAAFTIHTIANNIAGLIAPVLVGQIGMKNYHIGFLIAAVAAFLYGSGSVGTIYTVLGLVLAPVFVWLWTKTRATHIRTTYKYGLGILFTALGYGLLTIPIVLFKDQAPYSLLWMVFYYLFLTFSDNLVGPIGLSFVVKLSPDAYHTQMQTAWGQAGTIGNGIALVLFNFYQTADQQVNLFPIMTALLLVTALFIFVFSKNIEKDMV
ncbi:MAG: MFS transporter [Paenibacillus macerans]|uniref:Amino acid/peptide transporter family protein n=2 Tax=Paenibacillus macerans TaxID=44252 RepID=A0A090ZWL5_PAEMA|nr:MFS transporter [Paenibacillus macerans]KFN08521.1 amino acid/peptide transporter family protein [Paenibacillus macerans]MBS5913882.1 MFS transporter [Paenibacillus macerans]MCY7561626.1 MFS transporter [Paenibacillus macerans]MDU7477510.1 MFS transporter [Paenibacillus macerans]MEC0135782.1 MFS transporter [Paenibacillus macerans]